MNELITDAFDHQKIMAKYNRIKLLCPELSKREILEMLFEENLDIEANDELELETEENIKTDSLDALNNYLNDKKDLESLKKEFNEDTFEDDLIEFLEGLISSIGFFTEMKENKIKIKIETKQSIFQEFKKIYQNFTIIKLYYENEMKK